MLYKERAIRYISAHKLKKPSDLPESLGIRSGEIIFNTNQNKNEKCPQCGNLLREHGLTADNQLICPGTYLLDVNGILSGIMSEQQFEELYIPLGEVISEV